jgi:hypothetical protein
MFEKIASILGGNLFSGIADIISKVVTDPTEKAKLQAELAEMQVKHEETMQTLAASDRDSARKREMEVKDWTPSVLSWTVLAFWGLGNYFVFTHALPAGSETLIARVLGTIDMAVGLVLGYYFGSSAGSASKSDTIDHLVGK